MSKRISRPQTKTVATIVLLALAIVLGNLVGSKFFANRTANQNQKTDSEQERTTQGMPTPQPGITPEVSSATVIIDGVEVKTPGSDSTDEEKRAFTETISKLAVETDTIKVSAGCEFSPKIARIAAEKELKLVNTDSSEHTMKMYESEFKVPANGETVVTPDFGRDRGIFGVSCDTGGTLGFVELVPQE